AARQRLRGQRRGVRRAAGAAAARGDEGAAAATDERVAVSVSVCQSISPAVGTAELSWSGCSLSSGLGVISSSWRAVAAPLLRAAGRRAIRYGLSASRR